MARRPSRREKVFRQTYLPRLKRIFRPEVVLLFGSHARDEALADSDLDLVIVSKAFEGVPFLERAARVIEGVGLEVPADLLCYTPREFARKRRELGIVQAAVEEGIRL